MFRGLQLHCTNNAQTHNFVKLQLSQRVFNTLESFISTPFTTTQQSYCLVQ
jgi:hypothetical protein